MKWKHNLLRLHELKKKERATIARSQALLAAHIEATAKRVALHRAPRLMTIPEERLPYLEDKLMRRRATK